MELAHQNPEPCYRKFCLGNPQFPSCVPGVKKSEHLPPRKDSHAVLHNGTCTCSLLASLPVVPILTKYSLNASAISLLPSIFTPSSLTTLEGLGFGFPLFSKE